MEELKVIMETLSKMGDGAQTAFIWWCFKEFFAYSMCPVTVTIIGLFIFKIMKYAREND